LTGQGAARSPASQVLTASFVGDIEVQEVTAANTSISDCGENGLGQPAAGAGREENATSK